MELFITSLTHFFPSSSSYVLVRGDLTTAASSPTADCCPSSPQKVSTTLVFIKALSQPQQKDDKTNQNKTFGDKVHTKKVDPHAVSEHVAKHENYIDYSDDDWSKTVIETPEKRLLHFLTKTLRLQIKMDNVIFQNGYMIK